MERRTVALEAPEESSRTRKDALFVGVLAAQVLAFAAAAASGNIPDAVLVLFRALLTL